MSDALSISPPPRDAESGDPIEAGHAHDRRGRRAARPRRIESRHEIALGAGLEFAFATENIAEPTQWTLQQPRHTLIVHLGGGMRRLETRIEGAGRLRAPAEVGDCWLIPAGRAYLGRALGGEIAYAELSIDPRHYAALGAHAHGADTLAARMKHRDPFVHGVAARLAHLSEAGDDLAAMLRESLGQALSLHLLREHGGAAAQAFAREPEAGLTPAARRRIEDYIRAHLDERITLSALAHLAELSPHRLLIAFRQSFGATPIQYVLGERLRRVCLRLRGGADDIATIAVEAGFSSHSHLSAVFKKRYGVTPKQYRRHG